MNFGERDEIPIEKILESHGVPIKCKTKNSRYDLLMEYI